MLRFEKRDLWKKAQKTLRVIIATYDVGRMTEVRTDDFFLLATVMGEGYNMPQRGMRLNEAGKSGHQNKGRGPSHLKKRVALVGWIINAFLFETPPRKGRLCSGSLEKILDYSPQTGRGSSQ